MVPIKIEVIRKSELHLLWSDNTKSKISSEKLRKFCPCATCMAERESHSKTFIPIFYSDQITVAKISKVGNYAINISWKDGHNTGIYEFYFLKNLSDNESS